MESDEIEKKELNNSDEKQDEKNIKSADNQAQQEQNNNIEVKDTEESQETKEVEKTKIEKAEEETKIENIEESKIEEVSEQSNLEKVEEQGKFKKIEKQTKPKKTKVVNEKVNENQEEKNIVKKTKKIKKKTIIFSLIVILFLMIFSVIFSLINMNNEKIIKGISILGIDIENLTIDEAKNKINDAINNRFNDENNNLILKRNDNETSVTANTFNAKFDIDTAINEAYNVGRSGNIITDNYSILFTLLFKRQIEPELYLDEELLQATIKDVGSKMTDRLVENSYYVEDEELTIVRGKAGYVIDEEKLKKDIYTQLRNIHTSYQVIEIPVIYKEPGEIDLEKIRNEIYKEPKDAYVEKNPTKVYTHVNGIDFKISMEEAKKLIQEDKEEYVIPLKITVPKKTINDLGEEAFPDLLASFSTTYDVSNYNRSTNIELASKKMNGTVVMPGENFSYNTVIGKRTLEAGYKEGTAYIGGKVVPDVGGGVCQLSSTLYNTALLANLKIIDRSNHLFLTGYVAAGRDATVYYGSIDFVFQNSRKYPIKIVSNSKNGVCKVSIYGIKEEVEYEVVIQSKIISYINQTTTYKDDPTLEKGKEVVEQYGSNGCRSEAYRILKLNGKVVSQDLLSKDTYKAMERIVRRGTKEVEKAPEVSTEASTEPTEDTSQNSEVQNTET